METEYLQFHVQRAHIPWFSSKVCKRLLGWSQLALREKYSFAHLSLPTGALTICPVHFPKALFCSAGSAMPTLSIPAGNEQRSEEIAISQVNFTLHCMQRRPASFHIFNWFHVFYLLFLAHQCKTTGTITEPPLNTDTGPSFCPSQAWLTAILKSSVPSPGKPLGPVFLASVMMAHLMWNEDLLAPDRPTHKEEAQLLLLHTPASHVSWRTGVLKKKPGNWVLLCVLISWCWTLP